MNDKITIGEKYRPAMEMTDPEEANAYLKECIEHTMRTADVDRRDAAAIERENLGYFAGYYGRETRARVERLFGCAHPVFGSVADNGSPSPEQAFYLGQKAAEG